MKKTLFWVLAFCLVSLSFGRVGPVSQYGQLMAGKAGSKGQIYGSCQGVKSGAEVAVQGMSLFWSISSDVGSPFWTSSIVNGLVEKQNIQIIRAPMGVDEDWGSGNYFSDMNKYQGLMNAVVQAAIDNDIYVIIDYHSHKASDNVNNAKTFFSYMAQKWGGYDNVIFEVFNEPTSQSWGTIKTYAESVIETIRQYSDNLVLVGNPNWDQHPDYAINNTVRDSKNNVAYTFHYYAGSHSTGGEGANAVSAMNAGLSVFVSEWGTVDASGNGGFSSGNSATWYSWMQQHKLSGANWSVSNKPESASYFNGSAWNYTESGNWVNTNIFSKLPKSYTKCGNTPASSSSQSSQSSASNSSNSSGNGTNKPLLVDNFEDGDYTSLWDSPWTTYNDNGDGGQSTIDTSMATGNSSSKAIKVTYSLNKGNYEYSPYVGLVVSANADEVTPEDLSTCSAIQYDYKGDAHDFRVQSTVNVKFNYHKSAANSSSGWKTRTVYWDDLAQEAGWGIAADISNVRKAVTAFSWQLQGTSGTAGTLQIDNVKCLGLKEASSSSAAQSSSSVQSSSSNKPSSSSVASSSSAQLVITGNLTQTVTRGGSMQPVIFTNVGSFQRTSQNIRYLNMNQSGNVLTLDATVPASASLGTFRENFKVNGTAYTMVLTVEDVSSSSVASSSSAVPESSAAVSNEWQSNAQLSVNSNGDVVIGQSEGWTPDRVVTKGMGEVEAKKSYTLSFDASLQQNTMDMAISLGSYCNGSLELNADEGVQAYTCTFKALQTENVVLTLTMPGSRWEEVTISNLSLKKADGQETQSSSSVAESSSSSEAQKFEIKFVVSGTTIQTILVEEGAVPQAPTSVELPANTAQYSYSFGGWTPELVAATEPATYTAVIVPTVNAYKITFLNYDNTELWWTNVDYGKTPVYAGPEPVRAASESYTYEFKGWNPALKKVVAAASYKAEYNEIPVEVSSSSVAESSSSEESSSSVASSASGDIIISGNLVQTVVRGGEFETVTFTNVTTFSKETYYMWWLSFEQVGNTLVISNEYSTQYLDHEVWTEKIKVNGTQYEVKATIVEPASSSSSNVEQSSSSAIPNFTVTFKNGNRVLQTGNVEQGTIPVYSGETPVKNATAEYTYTFVGWDPAISEVTGPVTYTAQFSETKNTYRIAFVDDNGTSVLLAGNYEYGTAASDIETPANPTKPSTAEYTYIFDKWTPAIANVTGPATYTATYKATKNMYTIVFLNYDNTELQNTKVEYGTMPEYKGKTPTKPSSKTYNYIFESWTPDLVEVTGKATYMATFRAEAIPVESSSSAEETSSSSEEVVVSSSSEEAVSSSSENVEESSSSEEVSSSSEESSNSVDESSSSVEESPCIAFVNGQGGYSEHCYNSGLSGMGEGVCYTLNPERASDIKWTSGSATDSYWWVETSCQDFAPPSSSSQKPEAFVAGKTSGLNMAFSHNVLTVAVPKQSLVRVQVFDMLGNRVKTFQDSFAGSRDISLQGLPQGSYMVRVMSGSSAKTSRISIR